MDNNNHGDPNTFLSVDKMMLFGIMYTPNNISSSKGNLSKSVLFYHLIHGEHIVDKV